jgi:hypothetical protein
VPQLLWSSTCNRIGVAELLTTAKAPGDELKDIADVLEKSGAETDHVHRELESMLDELRSLAGKSLPPKAA